MIQRLYTTRMEEADVAKSLRRPLLHEMTVAPQVQAVSDRIFGKGTTPSQVVQHIIAHVRERGDEAVLHYTQEIDGVMLSAESLFVSEDEIEAAKNKVQDETMRAIRHAAQRIQAFHEKQRMSSWFMTEQDGTMLGQQVLPLERVGCYVPGGRFPLVSTALMSVIPARVAGVQHIVAATPTDKNGELNPHMIVALHEAGAHRILRVGGAQTIAALALGTETIPRVDKIVGPGNLFVTLAKNMVFGEVGIDSLAGPSEVLIVADDTANPAWVAADMLSQAEHDTEAAALFLTPSATLAEAVEVELEKQLNDLPHPETARASLERWGRIVVTRDIQEAIYWANFVAPEHMELMVENPTQWLGHIKHAGALFLGDWSTEPIGDYIAGPNHILPTSGTARFTSPLGVDQFLRRSGLIYMSEAGLQHIGRDGAVLARLEGLEAHARAIEQRLNYSDKEVPS